MSSQNDDSASSKGAAPAPLEPLEPAEIVGEEAEDASELVAELVPDLLDVEDVPEPDADDDGALPLAVPLTDPLEVGAEVEPGDDVEGPVLDVPPSTAPVLFEGKRLPETLSALNVYLARLKDVEILPIEEQTRLAARFQQDGDREAAAKLVASNLRLVVKIAFQFRRQWADVMDLVAEGNLGLSEAIRKFDPERGIPFPSYARFWIRARILAFIQENKHLIHAGSRAARKLFWRLERERRRLIQEGREPGPALLAERVGVKTQDVLELAPILDHRPVSLDLPAHGDEDGRSRGEVLADASLPSPEEAVGDGEIQDRIRAVFADFRQTLAERDQAIWDQRLVSDNPVRLEDLGDAFGVSKERVRQLEVRIKKRLQAYVKKHLGEDVIVQAFQ